jgi:putative transposase
VLDDFSRAITGYYLALDAPASWKTALAFRQSILRKDDPRWHVFGIPEKFYTDHGSDYTSKRIELLCAEIHVQLVHSQIGEPRGRGKVERLFRSINELFLCSVPGYAPARQKPVGPLITLEELEKKFREWLVAEYMNRRHSEIETSPQAKWEAGGFIPRMPNCLQQLDVLLCTEVTQRKVHPDGVRFYGYVGQLVTVRFDPRDLAEIRLYYR